VCVCVCVCVRARARVHITPKSKVLLDNLIFAFMEPVKLLLCSQQVYTATSPEPLKFSPRPCIIFL
jgi:hypothetical protein